MNRQNIRKLLLIISLLLFPITIWYMSPYLIIQGAMEGIITGSFVVFTCMLLGSIFAGDCSVHGCVQWVVCRNVYLPLMPRILSRDGRITSNMRFGQFGL